MKQTKARTIKKQDTLSLKELEEACKSLEKYKTKPSLVVSFDHEFPFIHVGWYYIF